MNLFEEHRLLQTRCAFLGRASNGIGTLALASMLAPDILKGGQPGNAPTRPKIEKWAGAIHPLHHAPKAKRVIFLCMAGGPSHLETFDDKPQLAR